MDLFTRDESNLVMASNRANYVGNSYSKNFGFDFIHNSATSYGPIFLKVLSIQLLRD